MCLAIPIVTVSIRIDFKVAKFPQLLIEEKSIAVVIDATTSAAFSSRKPLSPLPKDRSSQKTRKR